MELIHRDQRGVAAETLAIAFHDDPLLLILAPDPEKRRRVGPWFMGVAVEAGLRWGQVWGNEDASAVAVWFGPGNTDLSIGRMLRAGMGALPLKVGLAGAARFLGALGTTERFHKAVHGPHWYLLAIGTRPERQGQGLGSTLLEAGTRQADAAGLPCYLETATDINRAYYEKRGFRAVGSAAVRGHTITGMVRDPR